jgi:hypothetical protein
VQRQLLLKLLAQEDAKELSSEAQSKPPLSAHLAPDRGFTRAQPK